MQLAGAVFSESEIFLLWGSQLGRRQSLIEVRADLDPNIQ